MFTLNIWTLQCLENDKKMSTDCFHGKILNKQCFRVHARFYARLSRPCLMCCFAVKLRKKIVKQWFDVTYKWGRLAHRYKFSRPPCWCAGDRQSSFWVNCCPDNPACSGIVHLWFCSPWNNHIEPETQWWKIQLW